jgi:endo-1,4-beta-xylanase
MATGGRSETGGKASTGGTPATGGKASSTGGVSATGGAPATGGKASSTGGVSATGGAPATGGSTATGGTSSGVPDNVLMSYSFEGSTTDGWRGRGAATVTVSDEEAHSGSSSLKVTGRTAAWHGTEYDVLSLVTPGDSYDVTAWARLTDGSPSSTLILTREVQGCDVDEFVRIDLAENATDADWVELTGTLTLPASCDPTRLVVYVESEDATASYYVDDTSMCPQ